MTNKITKSAAGKVRRQTGPELGLVCITESDEVRFRTITRTRLQSLSAEEQQAKLSEIYRANLARLATAFQFCRQQRIRLYRMTSDLFPHCEEGAGRDVLMMLAAEIAAVGREAQQLGIRLVMHPDQFVVLSSDSAEVVANSIKILTRHAMVFDMLGLPQSSWAAMTIHGGKGGRAGRLVEVVSQLPAAIKNRLTLENDERAYRAVEILEVCRQSGVPMIFDAHHHICHEKLTSYEDASVAEMLAVARTTWPVRDWQIVHLSNGREHFNDMRHSDLISSFPSCYWQAPWIEVEAKAKERAIAGLRQSGFGVASVTGEVDVSMASN